MQNFPLKFVLLSVCVSGTLVVSASAQSGTLINTSSGAPAANAPASSQANPAVNPADVANYILGPEDQITVHLFGAYYDNAAQDFPERPTTITNDGNIDLPMIGMVHAAGLTIEQLEAQLVTQYKKYFKNPQVSVDVTDYHSQPASVAGAVNQPGMIQLRGNRNLMEVIASAGGMRLDAGNDILITRRLEEGPIPVDGSFIDASGKYSVAHIDMRAVLDGRYPQGNIVIKPHDVITVQRAKMVYVMGNVNKAGGFVLTDSETISVTQALALAGGWTTTASLKNAKILRSDGGAQHTEVPANVLKIVDNKAPDLQLHADDILFVPNSASKSAGIRAVEAAISIGTGFAIWR